jgi:glutathione S-transferase
MRLLLTATSPYARKVRIAILEKRIPCEMDFDNPLDPTSHVPAANPLGKVPVLVLDDGRALWDSPVIVQYLEQEWPEPPLLPPGGWPRIEVLRWEALCDGLCDAAVQVVLEGRRAPERQDAAVVERQRGKVLSALARAEADLGQSEWASGGAFSLADIALASALGYLDLRLPGLWRGRFPGLESYAERIGQRPSVAGTAPPR